MSVRKRFGERIHRFLFFEFLRAVMIVIKNRNGFLRALLSHYYFLLYHLGMLCGGSLTVKFEF